MKYKFESEEILGIIKDIEETGLCFTDKGSLHTYTGMYEGIMSQYKNKDCSLLEIGVYNGGSALLWSKYLPNAKLFFTDINDMVNPIVFDMVGRDRYQFYVGDAYSDDLVNTIKNGSPDGFDIIIDDGPHTLSTMIEFIRKYLPIVKKGGYLIIEDVQDIYWCDILRNEIPSEYKENIEIIDTRHFKDRYDDIVFVVKKVDSKIEYPLPRQRYKHYKGGTYEVITLATHTETGEKLVVYKSINFGSIYVRPLDIWNSTSEDGQRRFELI
jgi:hypothetical protein